MLGRAPHTRPPFAIYIFIYISQGKVLHSNLSPLFIIIFFCISQRLLGHVRVAGREGSAWRRLAAFAHTGGDNNSPGADNENKRGGVFYERGRKTPPAARSDCRPVHGEEKTANPTPHSPSREENTPDVPHPFAHLFPAAAELKTAGAGWVAAPVHRELKRYIYQREGNSNSTPHPPGRRKSNANKLGAPPAPLGAAGPES